MMIFNSLWYVMECWSENIMHLYSRNNASKVQLCYSYLRAILVILYPGYMIINNVINFNPTEKFLEVVPEYHHPPGWVALSIWQHVTQSWLPHLWPIFTNPRWGRACLLKYGCLRYLQLNSTHMNWMNSRKSRLKWRHVHGVYRIPFARPLQFARNYGWTNYIQFNSAECIVVNLNYIPMTHACYLYDAVYSYQRCVMII